MTMTETVAREYLRVSFDASGRERSQDEQHGDNQRAADRRGWTLGSAYRDTGSASRYGRKTREDYARLVADLEHDRFGAQVLILWESSRGSRKLSEWVRLIELAEARAVHIYVTSDGKLYDPTEARDRRSLQEDATDAEYESAKISKRTKRAAAANAAEGRPGPGQPAYGYRRTYDPSTGRMTGQEIEPAEAAIVREIYQRLHSGHSLRSIANDLETRGVRTRAGRVFSPHTLRSIVLNRANIGERVHDPGPSGRRPTTAAASIVPATWPPIVDRALWTAVHRRLTDPARTTTRPGRGVHWLTQIAVCDACDGPMQARAHHAGERELIYFCHAGTHVRVLYEALNTYAEAVLLAYLARDDVAHKLTAQPVDPATVAALDVEIAGCEQELADLGDALGRREITPTLAARAEPGILARLNTARVRREALTAPSLLRGLIKPGREVKRRWKAAPMSARREIARLLFVPDLIGELRIVKGPLRDPISSRVVWKRP